MKDFLLRQFATNYGALIRWITAAIVAVIVTGLARLGIDLSPEDTATCALIVGGIVGGAIGEWVLKHQGKSIEQIQEAAKAGTPRLEVDKYAGPETIKAVEKMAARLGKVPAPQPPSQAPDQRFPRS